MKSSTILLSIFIACLLVLIVYLLMQGSGGSDSVATNSPNDSVENKPKTVQPMEVYAAIDQQDFLLARELISKIKSPSAQHALTTQMNQAIEQKLIADATDPACLDVFLGKDIAFEDFWLEVALRNRLGYDAKQPYEWFAKHQTELPEMRVERAALAFARHQCSLLEWREARKWHALIKDEELAVVVDKEIGGCMEARIRADIAKGAAAGMEQLLLDDSGYETFWLEIGMNELLVNQPMQADTWYAANKDKLTPLQHERVALACLRHHLAQGSPPDAELWRKLIVSEELQKVVDAEMSRKQAP